MLDEYIRSLAQDYLSYCQIMADGAYRTDDEYRQLSADRTNCHNELIRVLGDEYARPFDMKAHCRALLAPALP